MKNKQLEIDGRGRLTLDGIIVEAEPRSEPFLIELEGGNLYNFKQVLERTLTEIGLPRGANTYVSANSFHNMSLRFNLDTNDPYHKQIHFVAVQAYKIKQNRREKNDSKKE